ncbi:tetratricopeptide repeat protein [Chelativorans sp. YIM 93263]|uniref:tetratricopeptide repeat protein n=1 Tax=Chelativorans sp. YIM 93263 TaxID=2906648 RepID=UPI0023780399|nr:tetratricopeptide repeat protein [Chelativorans sp. YIM 93263]
MSDDSFIREVNEEVRQDRYKTLWRQYGAFIVGAVALIILAAAAYVAYDYWSTSRANRSGDEFARALELAEEGNNTEALAVLEELEDSGYGSYPVLARMRAASIQAESGNIDEAVANLDAVMEDSSAPGVIREIARLRAGLLLVDHGSYADVAARVEALTSVGNPMRHTAREALALAAWKEGERDNALTLFGEIADDPEAPADARQRAEMMSELISGSGSESG